jgi:hypothetical protein
MSLVVVLLARVFMPKRSLAPNLYAQIAINIVANSVVLVAGLWFFGRDGKMATYTAMVLVSGSLQWLLCRGWRRA